jgi:hypothetical protein
MSVEAFSRCFGHVALVSQAGPQPCP